uniref:Uncharacterized protein n=1 Tax=Gopherus agassizii TaxID=38772 RepID=A0A452H0X1_9SAUR
MALNCYWGVLAVCVMTFPSTLCFQQDRSRVLLLSFDGFRWDYIYKFPTPNFHYIMKNGAHVKQVTNVFITKTYPNHYTMVTDGATIRWLNNWLENHSQRVVISGSQSSWRDITSRGPAGISSGSDFIQYLHQSFR